MNDNTLSSADNATLNENENPTLKRHAHCNATERIEISYESFIIGPSYMSESICSNLLSNSNHKNYEIAARAPKGPFLPLTVTAMYSLQLLSLFQLNNKNALIPIDYDNVLCDRLLHVMNDTQSDSLLVMKNEASTLDLILDDIKGCSLIVLDLCY